MNDSNFKVYTKIISCENSENQDFGFVLLAMVYAILYAYYFDILPSLSLSNTLSAASICMLETLISLPVSLKTSFSICYSSSLLSSPELS